MLVTWLKTPSIILLRDYITVKQETGVSSISKERRSVFSRLLWESAHYVISKPPRIYVALNQALSRGKLKDFNLHQPDQLKDLMLS